MPDPNTNVSHGLLEAAYQEARVALSTATAEGGQRLTAARQEILAILITAGEALSAYEIKGRLQAHVNLVTIYRVVEWLGQRGLVECRPDSSGVIRALVTLDSERSQAWLECTHCRRVLPLLGAGASQMSGLPAAISVSRVDVMVHGACERCSSAQSH